MSESKNVAFDEYTKVTDGVPRPSLRDSLAKTKSVSAADPYSLICNTYVLLLELNWINMDQKTFSVWCEIGFLYDCHDYLRSFDYLIPSDNKNGSQTMASDREERLSCVTPEQMKIQFDICNTISMEQRTETHFIRKHVGQPTKFYSEDESCPKGRGRRASSHEFLSDDENIVSSISLDTCPPNTFWKHETRTYIMELSLKTNQHFAPFDELYLFFKLITCNCQPGSCHVYWNYMKDESSFHGMQQMVGGYIPVKNEEGIVEPMINKKHKMNIDGQQWDRLYVSVRFKKDWTQDVIQFYVVPFLTFCYIPIRNFESADDLLAVSSTLVIANVALLIVTQHKVFSFSEMSIIIQIILLLVSTILLALYSNYGDADLTPLQRALLLIDGIAFVVTLSAHYLVARHRNLAIFEAVTTGNFDVIDTV